MPDYSSLIPYKIRDVVSLLMEKRHDTYINSIRFLYSSKMYEHLCNEETKLWHLSPHKLLDLLEEEKKTKQFTFPDFV